MVPKQLIVFIFNLRRYIKQLYTTTNLQIKAMLLMKKKSKNWKKKRNEFFTAFFKKHIEFGTEYNQKREMAESRLRDDYLLFFDSMQQFIEKTKNPIQLDLSENWSKLRSNPISNNDFLSFKKLSIQHERNLSYECFKFFEEMKSKSE